MDLMQALVTAILSGLFSGILLFGLSERKDRFDHRLAKVEEAYLAVLDWSENIQIYYSRVYDLLSHKMSPNDHLSTAPSESAELFIKMNKMEMLIAIHIPHLLEECLILTKCTVPLSEIVMKIVEDRITNRVIEYDALSEYDSSILKLIDAKKNLIGNISRYGQGIAHRPTFIDYIWNWARLPNQERLS